MSHTESFPFHNKVHNDGKGLHVAHAGGYGCTYRREKYCDQKHNNQNQRQMTVRKRFETYKEAYYKNYDALEKSYSGAA
jgi:Na+-transporting NADH:ubiquinone oxidoreductase subunit NqrF